MIPGLTSEAEARLLRQLHPDVTDVTQATFAARNCTLLDGDGEARRLGIEVSGPGQPLIVVTDIDCPVGRVRMHAAGRDALLFIDNAGGCAIHADIRILGNDSVVFFNTAGGGHVGLPTVFLRSHGQFLFWGRMATAVELSIEVEGEDQGVVIGDDALIADGVWIRNHDMHAMHDLASGRLLSRPPVTTVIERHVWLGQGALLLSCERVGTGAIVGARSVVKGTLPRCVAAVGAPARIVREGVSWGRDVHGMSAAERASVGCPAASGER